MRNTLSGCLAGLAIVLVGSIAAGAAPLSLTVPEPVATESGYFKMGTARRPDGRELTVDSQSLRLDGRPWVSVMGEFHYSRYPQNEWRDELFKMRAGGIDIVATYAFWIHHEEEMGVFNWSGQRDLRKFVETAREAGLAVVVRCGPWCHGEVRNGGLPDWILKNGCKVRSDDPVYLAKARVLYGQIAAQLKGLLWKDGGPVVAVQLENEYGGPAEHLMSLKAIARDVGLDTPFYTRTGWPNLRTPAPLGEMLPLYGSYADGFWHSEITPMPKNDWDRFLFPSTRVDTGIGADIIGQQKAGDAADTLKYPFLTCELGGGMANSYHRRVLVDPRDIDTITLLHIGAGSNLPGYYMYHGGANPEGKLSTLQESIATNYPNDLPVKTYDFQAPLGEYGQTRPHYHSLRRLHLFLHDFGEALAGMPPVLPVERPKGRDDLATLRWSVRSNGKSGFVFVNNYQRLQPMPPKPGVQFALTLPSGGGVVTFPTQPVTVPANRAFFWPFNLDLGGVTLRYATAQPICKVDDGDVRTLFFAQIPGVPAEFIFDDRDVEIQAAEAKAIKEKDQTRINGLTPGLGAAIRLINKAGNVFHVVLLNEADSLTLWKGNWQGRERVFLTGSDLIIEKDALRLIGNELAPRELAMLPAPAELVVGGKKAVGLERGVFRSFQIGSDSGIAASVEFEKIQSAGSPRTILFSGGKKPVAMAPTDADFAAAAVWRIKLPPGLDLSRNPILRLRYVGDVARVLLTGRLITDNYYNGFEFDLGLRRHAPEILNGELRLEILPLRKDAPIYLAEKAKPDFGKSDNVAALSGVELVYRDEVRVTLDKEKPVASLQDVTFANPIVRQRADPFIMRHTDGSYYFIATAPEFDRIELSRAPTIGELGQAKPVIIWTKHADGPMSAPIWAPEIHFIDGKWFIYYAAGGPGGIRIYTLENASADPFAPTWVEKGRFQTGMDSFSLDSTTFTHRGKRYFVWAQQDAAIRGNTNLYIAEMDTPCSIVGKPVMLSKPDRPWEQILYWVNEGPAILKRNGRIFLTYSASGTDANYCMGMLTASDDSDLLDAKSWVKSPQPVFRTDAAAGQFGPGHNSFTVLPDGQTDVMVYHARNYEKIVGNPLRDPNRHARAQVLHWNPDGTPDFGRPVPDASPVLAPELF